MGLNSPSQCQTSVSLEAALDLSLAVNPSLQAAQARTKAAQASVSQATGNFLPQLNLNAGYTKYQEPNTITPIHEVGVFPLLDDEIYNANLNLSLPIFDGGRRLSNRKIAKASETENKANRQLIKQTVIQQITEIYLLSRQVEDQSNLIDKRLHSIHYRYQDLLALESEGRVPPGDVALVASTLAKAQADSIAIDISKNQIALRLGLLLGEFQPITPELSSVNRPVADLENHFFETGTINIDVTGPVLKAALARQQKSSAALSIAKKSFWPEVSVFGSYVYRSGSDLDPIGEWMAGFKISLPIFQGGTRVNKIKETKALANASFQTVKIAQIEQNINLQISFDDYVSNQNRFQLLSKAENEKIKSVSAQDELYKAGRIPLRDLHIQELELLQLQLDKNKLLFSSRSALLRYVFVAGTLTKEKAMMIAGGLK